MKQNYLLKEPPGFQPYNGFLNIYKEAGYTSMDVCAKLRGILKMKKIGHAGTLDPMAEGVLPVALGRATREIDRVGDGTKTYRAGMLLGVTTDTQDTTGRVIKTAFGKGDAGTETAAAPSEAEIRNAVLSFIGSYEQLTPMYSARKVNGKKLYEYARAGKEVERKTKKVSILSVEIEEINFPHVVFTVSCTKGTYIRTLCHDIGEKLGTGACMESLVRTRVGDFTEETAVRLSEVEAARDRGAVDGLLFIKTPTAVAIGKFDGNHIGHQKLFSELRKTAQEQGLKTCVLILNNGRKLLEPRIVRRREFCAEGIDYVIELPFTEELRQMPAETFLREILINKLSMHAIVGGTDISFGFQKEGGAAFLQAHAAQYGYRVRLIDKLAVDVSPDSPTYPDMKAAVLESRADGAQKSCADGVRKNCADGVRKGCAAHAETVSSTLVREALAKGDMELVARLLGRPYCICGRVVHGRHLGSTVLGFPTMNVTAEETQALPPLGVYATRTFFLPDRKKKCMAGTPEPADFHDGISDLGKKPTVSDEPDYDPERIDLETNLFDCSGDFYGREICVELLSFIRPERKFESIEAIREQLLTQDVPRAKELLAKLPRL